MPDSIKPRRRRLNLSPEEHARRRTQLKERGFAGGDMPVTKAARARKKAADQDVKENLQVCDIVEFATKYLKIELDGYPLEELIFRCSDGLPLPEGTLKTFVEVPSDGFAVKEVEMTWPEYFQLCSRGQQQYVPGKPYPIILVRAGRRSGKSTAATVKGLHVGTRRKWRDYLRANEIMSVLIVATRQDQAEEIIAQRCHELLRAAKLDWLVGALDQELHLGRVTNDTIPLICGTEIKAFPCNSKAIRGVAAPCVLFDEYPYFALEGRKRDKDVRSAATGGMAQFPGSQFMAIGTPAAEQGDFYDLEQLAKDDPSILALHAPSWTAAPILYRNNPDEYHKAFRLDPDAFNREYRAEYDKAVESMYREEDVLPCLLLAGEVPFNPSWRWGAGIDQSGLAGNDRFSLALAYYDPGRDVVGVGYLRSWKVADLDVIMADSRMALQRYRVIEAATDKYAKGYVHAALKKEGIQGVIAPPSVELHMEARRLMVGRKLELPMQNDVKEGFLQTQCFYTAKANTPSISHPRTKEGHGDEIEAIVRALHQAVAGNYMKGRFTTEERQQQDEISRREQEYDPSTYGRV